MTKTIEWVNPNKQRIRTGHTTFDRQTTAISAGQVIGGTQTAFVIRAATELWNGTYGPKPEGHFQTWDLDNFTPFIPRNIRADLVELTKTRKVLLHAFFTYNGERRTIHGWVAVQFVDKRRVVAALWVTGPTHRSRNVIDAVIPYITDEEDIEAPCG